MIGEMKSPAEIVRENPNCNYFISASAGTGKTYTLTSYYLGILEYWEKFNKPDIVDNILAVTFTNKAANEMKNRIMAEVRKKMDSNDYWKRVYSNMSRAVISTIDSLCRRILVEQNVLAGVDPNFTIISELKQMKIIDNVAKYAMEVAFQVYEGVDVRFSPLLPIERRSRLEKYVDDLKQNKEAILNFFEKVGDIDKVRNYISNVVKSWRLELNNSKVSERLLNVLRDAGESLKVFRTMCLIASELYEAETLDNFEYDFKGVLEKVISILQNPDVRKHYQERFKYIIVDEFQDTNDLQKSIFDLLHTDENYVFYVGDRKQSIYRFRGADVSVFVRTMSEFENRQKKQPDKYKILSLQTNFRSHRKLVDFFNHVSEHAIFKREIHTGQSSESEKVYYHEVFRLRYPELYDKMHFLEEDISTSNNQGADEELIPKFEFAGAENSHRVVFINVLETIEGSDYTEALLVAKAIDELVGKEMTFFEKEGGILKPITRKITYKDIAILSYKLSGVEEIYREVFAKFGIPLYVVKGRGFYRRPEIRAVVSALNVIQNPNNNYNFVEFFFTPFVEDVNPSQSFDKFKVFHRIVMKAKELKEKIGTYSLFQAAKELSAEDSLPKYVSKMIELIQKYDELKYLLRPAEVLKNFIKDSEYLRKLAKFDSAEQRLKNVKKLLDQSTEFNRQANSFLELTRLLEKISDLKETEASEVSEENDVVRMMTVHASKGLEFNIVFLVGNNYSERDEENVMFPLDDGGNGRYIYIKKFLEKFVDKIDIRGEDFKELLKELEAEIFFDETELLRKMYVAVTRAKEMLVVLKTTDRGKNSDGLTANRVFERAPLGEFGIAVTLNSELLQKIKTEFEGRTEKTTKVGSVLDEELIKKQIEDYSTIAYKRYVSPTLLYNIVDEKADIERIDQISEDFAEAGVLMTETQSYALDPSATISSKFERLIEVSPELLEGKRVHRKLMSVNKYSQLEYLVETKQVPEAILSAKVLKELFSCDKVLSEWRLAKHVQYDGRRYVLFGVPDKVFFKNGKIYVVDFKSSYLKEGSLELEKYRFQLQFYMHLLKDFGQVECGYIISTQTGWVVRVEKPEDDFEEEIFKRIRLFETSEVSNIW
ncbi:UvrD-helicase domain-containing protein [Fervidobacterium thailandense]|uniref:DNA 3'-5' helicase n=1 Tax=Fervidobacterium thailandense TaxID=1008305 RepID=A0A1E3G2Q3_9BACT|nr:UvrD-helicase domain-containing protein [Fervidobacterium thailandense]ODN29938.1 hypothetical protein A4H02_07995 [Fervidobacterium thailandense]